VRTRSARPSNIRSEIGERIADLRDSLKLTREQLCRAIAEGESEEIVHVFRLFDAFGRDGESEAMPQRQKRPNENGRLGLAFQPSPAS
jgi:hypothetical protein